ncbi:hypothetical protein [Shewanella marina]|uniref:hypothetical protein n=1 Tax=Shewanella marina TaxID=487319 RepID=UPI000470C9DE|nr:hypothetical protein [Shewanella marina]
MKTCLSIIILLSLLILNGCDGDENGMNRAVVAELIPSRLTAEFVKTAVSCGYEQANTDAVIIEHAADGSMAQIHHVDGQGKIDIVWPDNQRHLTVIEDPNQLELQSHLYLAAGDFGKFRLYQYSLDEFCHCRSMRFDLSQIKQDYPNHVITIAGSESGADVVEHTVCGTRDTDLPMLDITLFSESGDPSFAALLNPYHYGALTQTTVLPSTIFEGETQQGVELDIPLKSEFLQYVRSYANTIYGPLQLSHFEQPRVVIFPLLHVDNRVRMAIAKIHDDDVWGRLLQYQVQELSVDVNSSIELDDFSYDNTIFTEAILAFWQQLDNGVNEYDFKSIANGRNVLQVTRGANDYFWHIYAPVTGTFVELTLHESINNQIRLYPFVSLSSAIFGHQQEGGIDEYRRQLALESRLVHAKRSEYFAPYRLEQLSIIGAAN